MWRRRYLRCLFRGQRGFLLPYAMVGLGIVLTGTLLSISTLWNTQRTVWFYLEGLRVQYAAESAFARTRDAGGDKVPDIQTMVLLGCQVQLKRSPPYWVARAKGRWGVERVFLWKRVEGE